MEMSVLKMVIGEELDNRQIYEMPSPYKHTPYDKYFSEVTKSICSKPTTYLKVSKVIILGDLSVGKTCIVNRFCRQIFESGYKATIGVDFEVERFDVLNVPFHLQIWDTAGQERFKSIAQSYYRSAHVVVAFEFTSISTLSHSKKWLDEALAASGNMDPLLFLVGTKIDLVSRAAFENIEQSAIKFAQNLHMEYWPLSSRTGENVSKFFRRVAALSFNRIAANEGEVLETVIHSQPISFTSSKNQKKNASKCIDGKCKNS